MTSKLSHTNRQGDTAYIRVVVGISDEHTKPTAEETRLCWGSEHGTLATKGWEGFTNLSNSLLGLAEPYPGEM